MRRWLFSFLISATLAAQGTGPTSRWIVTMVAGSIGSPGEKMVLTLNPDSMSFATTEIKDKLTVPLAQVKEVLYSPERFNRAVQLGGKYHGFETPYVNTFCPSRPGCGEGALTFLAIVAVSSTMHGTSHYFTLTWEDRGVQQQMQFEVSKSDWEALSTTLRDRIGNRWVDSGEQKGALDAVFADTQRSETAVEIKRDSWCGDYALRSGAYRVVTTEQGPDLAVFFFSNSVSAENLRAVLHARPAGKPIPIGLEYAGDTGRIESIAWKGQRLVFTER
jgi:hypothetical protein